MSTHGTSESYSDDEVLNEDVERDDEEGPSGRLSRLKRPKIAPAPKQQRFGGLRQKPATTKAKGKGKGRNHGKLTQLMEMPLDVLFEITSQLEPLDILQLSRVSKRFRTIFASKGSRHIWVAARKNLPGMPDCPLDLSEPQYASLMFEHNCHACGKSRSQMADYSLRVNFCTPCFKINVKKGTVVLRPYGKIPDMVLTLLPRSLLKHRFDFVSPLPWNMNSFEATNNSRYNAFYVPEVEMVIKRYRALESDPTALKRFIDQQQAITSGIMKNAIILEEWTDSNKRQKKNDGAERCRNRRASIEAKLLEMGWDEKYFTSRWNPEWTALVDQPRELTPRIWKIIRPKLEAILEANKAAELRIARQTKLLQRKDELFLIWSKFVEGMPDTQERWLMPNSMDACSLPTVADMLMEDDTPLTEERLLARVDPILSDVGHFQRTVKHDLVKLLIPKKNTTSLTADNVEGDLTILDKASSLFYCPSWSCRQLVGFPAIFAHKHVKEAGLSWEELKLRIKPASEVGSIVLQVLNFFGIAKDMHVASLKDLDGRCVCLCGHPKFRAPMDFISLIQHLVDENMWYQKRVDGLRTSTADITEYLLHNDHDMTGSKPCVALLSANESASRSSENNANFHAPMYCKICLILTTVHTSLTSEDEIAYHMKSKHLKDVEDGDTLSFRQLYKWGGIGDIFDFI